MGPKRINYATGSNPALDPRDAQLSANAARIAALTAQVAYMTTASTYKRQCDMPAPLNHAFLSSSARPREFYCWLHGWNNTHKGNVCSVMTRDNQCTVKM